MIPLRTLVAAVGFTYLTAAVVAQTLPGAPEANGLTPVSETIYINTVDTVNNNNTESIGIAISRNGNVIVGWEDDGDGLTDNEAVWTLFNRDGVQVTQDTEITTIDPNFAGQTLTTKFLSYFRANGTAISGRTSWGPKIKANPFGGGIGMGATAFDLGIEVTELGPVQFNAAGENAGDFPAVQLLDDNGAPIRILSGLTDAYAERDGDVRIGDWDYLANGNIVIVGESRQRTDLTDIYGGASAENHAIVRVLKADGTEVKAIQLASETPVKAEMWHGVGVTKSGFAVRFATPEGVKIRLFDNTGTATSTNIDLAVVGGNAAAGSGGRGDGVGFHGNGNDAYAAVGTGTDAEGKKLVYVTVLNADGTLRWAKNIADDVTLNGPGRCDVGIDSLGRVAVVYDDNSPTGGAAKIVLGRLFDKNGSPLGGTFYVSEKELPDPNTLVAQSPRVAFRNDTVAVAWESNNSGAPDNTVVATRLFVLPVRPGSAESVGLNRIVSDTPVINPGLDALGNWEPYASVLGTSTFLIEGNTFADGTADMQRYVVAAQPAAGGAAKLLEGFFADDGTPFKGPINASRQNGNPGRVAGDTRPGAKNYIVGAEASPHTLTEFNSGNRWNTGYDRNTGSVESRYGTVQTFELDPVALTAKSLTKALDSAHGRVTTGQVASDQNTRFGGDVVGLDNGNFVSVVEDRSKLYRADGNAAVATIIAPDGSVVKETFKIADGDLWSNVAPFKGGFAVRVAGVFYFYNNAGDLQGSLDQNTSGETFDRGRGDGHRIGGHINSPYVYFTTRIGGVVRLAAWNAVTREFVALGDVSEGGFRATADRATLAVDALNRIVVAWVSKPDGYEQDQVAVRVMELDPVAKNFRAVTPSFWAFVNNHPVGIRTYQMTLATTTKQILVAAKGVINLANRPNEGPTSPNDLNFYTVISHPEPKEDPTPAVGAGGIQVSTTIPGGLIGTALTNVQVDTTGKVITAEIPAAGAQGYLTITPAVTIVGTEVVTAGGTTTVRIRYQ